MALIVGVDIGGTFADFAAVDTERGTIETLKVLTTPQAPGQDIAAGLQRLAQSGLSLKAIERFVHGTTVGVNTIIQRRGARVALLTTSGFTDILELARLRMPNPYSLFCERPPPLVAREHVFPIDERMSATGETLVAPQTGDVASAIAKAQAVGCEVIVVSFLHAWREPRHERVVANMIGELAPTLTVFCGSEVWPVIREYERTTTAVLNAYVQPRIDAYLKQVAAELATAGVRAPLLLTTSIGGTMTADAGRRDCVGMLLSGTASGVVGASLVAKAAGIRSVLTLDIGGTSADVALLQDGEPSFATGLSIGEFPLATTTVSVQSSGQGGGSIVWIDAQGVLQVGPMSAGSTPGPACFDRGGTAMTVTDAALIAGILGHGVIGYGAIVPCKALAEAAARPIADRLGIDIAQLADGVLRVTVSGMLIAIEQMLARAGVHASELTLMPFGGAGPMLGTLLAETAGIKRILVPASPGTLCALGAAAAAIRRDTMRTVLMPLSEEDASRDPSDAGRPRARSRGGRRQYGRARAVDDHAIGRSAVSRAVLRDHDPRRRVHGRSAELIASFHETYERTFGHADPEAPVQVVNLRVSSARPPPDIRLTRCEPPTHRARPTGRAALYGSGKLAGGEPVRSQDAHARCDHRRAGHRDPGRYHCAHFSRLAGPRRCLRQHRPGANLMRTDPITLQILRNFARATAESMATTLYRTAHSTFVKETEDFTIQLLDADGKTVASPIDLGATWYPGHDYGGAIALVEEGYQPGDIVITNDPYSGFLATHAPDIVMWKPVFHEKRIVSFAGAHIHNVDVGGAVPASLSRALTDVHQEGVRTPPMKLYRQGVLNKDLVRFILTNVRIPEQNWGDLQALVAAVDAGERRTLDLVRRFGPDTIVDGFADLLDYAEAQARDVLRELPDGEYRFEEYCDEDGPDGDPLRLCLALRIKGDGAELDFTGSDPQTLSSLNVPTGGHPRHSLLLVGTYYVLSALKPGIFLNYGTTRAFTCHVPSGSVLNPQFPAAVGMRSLTCGRLRSLIFGAFAMAVPDRMPSAPAGATSIVNIAAEDRRSGRRTITAIAPIVGGGGGMPHRDGTDGSGADLRLSEEQSDRDHGVGSAGAHPTLRIDARQRWAWHASGRHGAGAGIPVDVTGCVRHRTKSRPVDLSAVGHTGWYART